MEFAHRQRVARTEHAVGETPFIDALLVMLTLTPFMVPEAALPVMLVQSVHITGTACAEPAAMQVAASSATTLSAGLRRHAAAHQVRGAHVAPAASAWL